MNTNSSGHRTRREQPWSTRQLRRAPRRGESLLWVLTGVLVAICLCLWAYVTYVRTSQQQVTPVVEQAEADEGGKRLPRFPLQPLLGGGTPLELDDLAGQVVLVNFWGPWCPPCRLELPHLIELAEKLADHDDFRFLPVSCGTSVPEDLDQLRDDTRAFLQEIEKADITVYADPNFDARQAFDAVEEFQGYPTTFIMDRQGTIRSVWVGYGPDVIRQVERQVKQLLDQPAQRVGAGSAGASNGSSESAQLPGKPIPTG